MGIRRTVSLCLFIYWPTLGIGDVLSDSLLACAQLTSDTTRLACFDHTVEKIRKAIPVPPPGVALTAEQKFGLSNGQVRGLEAAPGPAPKPTALHAHIVSVSQYLNGRQTFVLDNKQVWQQIELDPDFEVRNGQEVTISVGALGSFWLSTTPRRLTRVKRIR